ncbi:hypothetical protein JAAARDRAFT_190011 [Jaapia argillacea MUCL 33604]|uniref:NmrA-like domain-containing protein n=1 Tax=Jaapia argillacea MUCL 33604 TaxID=933084 RepID=A0A067Q6P5_9AGAM|nr:hypothetical protein JAAARDRAFT_190011 [Jaapia argillacea MUCL 33604]
MSGFKKFAVAGAGNIGRFIAEELLKLKQTGVVSSVVVLTRESSAASQSVTELAKQGAKIAIVDYASPSSLASALAGIDVVASAVSGEALGAQVLLAEEAKKAGVKLFVPSEYVIPTEGQTEGALGQKASLHKKLKEIDLPYSLYHTGPFADWIFTPYFGWDLTNNKVTIAGEGNAPVSWTTRRDIARFISHASTAFPREKIEWRTFRIEGDRKSLNQIVADYQAKTGIQLEISRESRAELEAAVQKEPGNFGKAVQLIWDNGGSLVGEPGQLSNTDWPEWNPTSVVDAIIAANPRA